MKVYLDEKEIEKQRCIIINKYENDIISFWKFLEESNYSNEIKEELRNKFKLYGIIA